MKKIYLRFFTFVMAALFTCAALAGCVSERPKIGPPPEVVIGSSGLAVWNEVGSALYYVYVIDGGAEQVTDGLSVQLSDGQSLKVKAVSGRAGYDDSDFSATQTYHAAQVDPDHAHSDVNGDGICDVGGESVNMTLAFYGVNDLHGRFKDSGSQPGVDEFTTYMKTQYADTAQEEILLSSGDMWQGTAESSLNRGQLMTEWMNDMGFVSMTLGNHEFDWGPDVLTPNSELAAFPFLGINVTYNGRKPDYCKASTVVERGGVKIGVIGAIGDCLSSISGEFQSGLSFATGTSLTALVKTEAVRLRTEEECDFIVYSIHDGGSGFSSSGVSSVANADMAWYDTALSDGYVDLVFEAHTHQKYILQDEFGIYHMQGGGENSGVSCAEVSFNTVTKDYTVTPRMLGTNVYANSKLEDDPVVEELFGKYFQDDDPYAVLGSTSAKRDDKTILNQVAKLYYEKGLEQWKDYQIACGGGYLNVRSPKNLKAGEVSYADLFALLPFDNDIVLGRVKGSDLVKFLGRTSYHIYTTVKAAEVDNAKDYYIIVDSYTSSYKWNNITEIDRIKGLYARDLLADFIRAGNWAR